MHAVLLGLCAVGAAFDYQVVTVAQGGTIEGTVRWRGSPPRLQELKVTKDATTCGHAKANQRLIIGPQGGVANAYVYLADVKAGAPLSPQRAVLDQKKCEYSPHVLAVPVGSRVVMRNSDPVLHSVHGALGARTVFNLAQPVQGQRSEQVLTTPGTFAIKCDAGHPWMNAVVHVARNPYYALTGSDGRFRLHDVPAGTYQIVMWHEGWQASQNSVAVTYSAPAEQPRPESLAPRRRSRQP